MSDANTKQKPHDHSHVHADLDTSEGWCCDGRTYKEHADADGQCCQPKGTSIEQLPPEGREKAKERQKQG
jgi:hypothetical protein